MLPPQLCWTPTLNYRDLCLIFFCEWWPSQRDNLKYETLPSSDNILTVKRDIKPNTPTEIAEPWLTLTNVFSLRIEIKGHGGKLTWETSSLRLVFMSQLLVAVFLTSDRNNLLISADVSAVAKLGVSLTVTVTVRHDSFSWSWKKKRTQWRQHTAVH